jgi:hypothetical protein
MRAAYFLMALLLGIGMPGHSSRGEPVGDPSSVCAELTHRCRELAQKKRAEDRSGLWDCLGELQKACEAPNVSPRTAAAATTLYFMLPEFRDWDDRLEVLFRLEKRLKESAVPTPELIEVLDRVAATLALSDREEEGRDSLLEALELRRSLYGPEGAEAANGLLYLGQFYANWSEKAAPSANRKKAIAYGEEAMDLLWTARGDKDPQVKELMFHFNALLEQVGLEGAEKEKLLEKYRSPPRPR